MTNRRITLAERPRGLPKESNFLLEVVPVPEPGRGEFLVRTLYLSIDPYMRGRMGDRRSCAPPIPLGNVMIGGVVGEVVTSGHPGFAAGDFVEGRIGWQEYGLSDGVGMRRVDPGLAPITTALGVLGMTGLTAYFGMLDICAPKAGETVVVSAAAGAVGSIAGQIAKLQGCRVVGIAGGPRKTAYLTGEIGFDAGIDYKGSKDLAVDLAAACPDGVDVYFDNVGGRISDAVLDRLARGARIAICGTVSQTSLETPELGPRVQGPLMAAWATMRAFNVFQFADRHEEALARLAGWLNAGKLKHREHVIDGLENAPKALIGMLRGENFGKTIIKVAS